MKKYFLLVFLITTVFSLHATWTKFSENCTPDVSNHVSRTCYWAGNDTDPDEDGFWSAHSPLSSVTLYNCNYCPAVDPDFGVRLIDDLNWEPKTCAVFEYNNGLYITGFKHEHIRTYAQNNSYASTWMKSSNPGTEENDNYYDDDCDGYVNEFTFQYFENDYGNNRQTGESEFKVTLNVNEPVIYGTNIFDIKFEVFELEDLSSYHVEYPEVYDPSSVAVPVATYTVTYTGGSVVQTTITVPDNKDQVYVVRAHLMTRDAKAVNGFDSNGYYIAAPYIVAEQRDRLTSDNFYIMLSRYENGYPVSKKRADIVNLALYYQYMSDVGFLGRQYNYDSLNDEGYSVTFETGTFFSNHRQVPWCSEFVAGVYQGVDEGVLIYDYDYLLLTNSADFYSNTDYIDISTRHVADWFNQIENSANDESKKANLLPLTSLNYDSNYTPTPFIADPSIFSLEKIQAGDYLTIYKMDHSAIFLGYSSNTDEIFTIEGNQNHNTATLMVRKRDVLSTDPDYGHRINNIGKLPY